MTIPEIIRTIFSESKILEQLMVKHNFQVEYVAIDYGEYQDKVVSSLISGEPLGDFVRMGKAYMIPSLVQQDLFWPVDEYTRNDRVFNQKVNDNFLNMKVEDTASIHKRI